MKNKPIFLIFLSILVFGFVSCSFNEQQTDISFTIPAALCDTIFSPDVTSDDIDGSQEQEISEIQEGIQEGVQEGTSEQEEISEQQETDPQENQEPPQEPEKTYLVQVRLFVNGKESKSSTKSYNHEDISVTFEKIKIGALVSAEVSFMVQTEGQDTADVLATGNTNTEIVHSGTTVLDAELSVKLNSGNEENPPAKTAEYTINYYLQKAEESNPDYVLEKTEHGQGEVGTTTTVTADPDAYKGFNATEITQQEIKEDDSTVVNVYYDRKIYKLEYNDGCDDEEIEVPETKTYRYGATAFIDYALGTREGFGFIGWSDGTNTYKSSEQTTIAIPDADVTLTAVWEEILIPSTYTAQNVAQAIAALEKDAFIVVTGQISNQTISDINAALKALYTKYTTGQTDKCIKVTLDLSGTTGLTALDSDAFSECVALESIVIPSSVTIIGDRAFYGCSSLKQLVLPDGVESIGLYAFSGCEALESINIPAGITRIMKGTFADCASLQSITIPTAVTLIEDYAFSGCASITTITIPDGVETLPPGCFKDCTNLKTITIPSSVTAFLCDDYAGGGGTFQNCSSLQSITLPAGCTYVGREVFAGCSSLTSISIPETVTGINHGAFNGCSSLTTIDIPAAVTGIGQGAFYGCTKLQTVTFHESNHDLALDAGVFGNCTSLKSITLPANVKDCYQAFHDCTALETVVLPSTFEYIAYEMFGGCSALKSITIPDTVKEIGQSAFQNCTSLTTVTISEDSVLEKIYESAFYGCEKLSTIYIPDTVTEIQDNVFKGCTALTSITIPETTRYLDGTFESTTAIILRIVKEGPGTANFTIQIQVDELSQIEVEVTKSGSKYRFQAPEDYTTYDWLIDGVSKGTSDLFTFDTTRYPAGIHDLTLKATKTDGDETIYHSYSAQIKVTQE